jgi:hypothetical protein
MSWCEQPWRAVNKIELRGNISLSIFSLVALSDEKAEFNNFTSIEK